MSKEVKRLWSEAIHPTPYSAWLRTCGALNTLRCIRSRREDGRLHFLRVCVCVCVCVCLQRRKEDAPNFPAEDGTKNTVSCMERQTD